MKTAVSTPLRLVKLTLLGAALVPAGCIFYPLLRLLHNRVGEAVIAFAAYAAAIALSAVNRHRLAQGLQQNLWSEDQLEAARKFIALRWHSGLIWALIVFANGSFIFQFSSPFAGSAIFALLVVPSVAIADTKTLLRGPLNPRTWTRKPVDWSSFKPLQSSHWGER